MNSTTNPSKALTKCEFLYLGRQAVVLLEGNKVTITWDGKTMGGQYRNGQVLLNQPHAIAVNAAAMIRQKLGHAVSAIREEATPEGKVRKAVREAIGALDDVLLLANPVGMAIFFDEKTLDERKVPYGLGAPEAEGGPDYVVALRRPGGCQMLGLECKAPGESPRPNQREAHQRWTRAGIWMYTVQSGQEAELAIADARRRLHVATPQ